MASRREQRLQRKIGKVEEGTGNKARLSQLQTRLGSEQQRSQKGTGSTASKARMSKMVSDINEAAIDREYAKGVKQQTKTVKREDKASGFEERAYKKGIKQQKKEGRKIGKEIKKEIKTGKSPKQKRSTSPSKKYSKKDISAIDDISKKTYGM